MNNELNICQVSLPGNIPIIRKKYNNFTKIYKNVKFFIIVPKKDIAIFKKKLNFKNAFIISENKILTFRRFKIIANRNIKKKKYFKKIQPRLKWYYQQVLKISFVLDFLNNNNNIVIWDADTLILKKIYFFKNNLSISYGSTSEFHKAYYATNKIILKKLPKYFISCLAQFISLSQLESKRLKYHLSKFLLRKQKTSEWITNIVFKAISKTHDNYNGSMFSEYELIGQSNLIFNKNKQKLISGVRENLNGKLTNFQKKIAIFLGYSYVAYEHAHNNQLSKNMLKRYQDWYLFIKLIIRKTSNKFFRGLRHLILSRIHNVK